MELTINGESRDFDAQVMSVAELIEALGLGGRRLAVEVNRRIVKRGTYDEHTLEAGDVVEIVHFVGGGA